MKIGRRHAERGRGRAVHRRRHRRWQADPQSGVGDQSSNADKEHIPMDAQDLPPFARTKKTKPSIVADDDGKEEDEAAHHAEDGPGSTVFPTAAGDPAQIYRAPRRSHRNQQDQKTPP